MSQHEPNIEEQEEGSQLPLDIRALLLGIFIKIPWLLAGGVLSVILGLVFALIYTERVYRSETVMLYQAPAAADEEAATGEPTLFTLISMIKLPSNIEELRRDLEIPAALSTIGRAISVEVERRTSLVTIEVEWDDPDRAAEMANSIREIFLRNRFTDYEDQIKGRISELDKSIQSTTEELREADEDLREFTMENKIVDLSKEAQWFLEELTSLNILYDQAKIEKSTVDLQVENVTEIVKQLEQKVAAEERQMAAQTDAMSETNIRIQRLRESIYDDKQQRSREAELEQKKLALDRARENLELGVISKAEYEEALADYNAQMALTVDSEDVRQWKEEIEKLDEAVIPATGGSTASGNLLTSILLREFEIKLQQVAVDKKLEHLQEAIDRTQGRLDKIPALERQLVTLQREVTTLENEKKLLEEELVKEKRKLESGGRPFSLISEAKPPIRSSKSNRKVIFAGVTVVGSGFTFVLVVGLVLLDFRIKTGRELELKLDMPLLMEFRAFPKKANPFPGGDEAIYTERFRILARRLRTIRPEKGSRILFVSAGHDEGTSFVAANLAAVWGRQEEKVLLIDGQLRPPRDPDFGKEDPERLKSPDPLDAYLKRLPPTWREGYHRMKRGGIEGRFYHSDSRFELGRLVRDGREIGLADFLSGTKTPNEVIQPTICAGVDAIGRSPMTISPDVLNTDRMRTVVEQATADYDLLLIDAPPVGRYFDAEALAKWADVIVFVVRSKRCHGGLLEKMVARLESTGTPIVGGVLVDVEMPYYREVH